MGLLDMLRAAVPAATAARAGYVTGQRERTDDRQKDEDRTRAIAREQAATARQSRLDQMQEALHRSQMEENQAHADYYRTAKPEKEPVPHTIPTAEGVMQWDSTTRSFKPTGFHPPRSASEGAAASREKRDKRAETTAALGGVEKQIGDTRRDIADEADPKNPVADTTFTRLGQLRTRLDSLTKVGDSLNSEMKRPEGGAPRSTPALPLIPAPAARTSSRAPSRTSSRASSDPTETAAALIRSGRATMAQLEASGKSRAFKDSVRTRLGQAVGR